jgi:methyl-accepting chemotaxis protein
MPEYDYLAISGINAKIIKAPIGGEPMEIATIVKKIADGDLSQDLVAMGDKESINNSMVAMNASLRSIIQRLKTSASNMYDTSQTVSEITERS